jgi:IclR family KDG regulon transcriptional repressor
LILQLLTDNSAGLTFGHICERLELPRSSAHGLLHTMRDRGFLDFDEEGRRYKLGIRAWQAGQAYIRGNSLAATSRPYLQAARTALGETVQLAVLDGIHNVYLAKEDADQLLVLQSRVGARLPAYATGLGKVLLAGLDDDEVRRRFDGVGLQRFTANTITDLTGLLGELARIRSQGYGTDDGEYTAGVECVAVPVRGHEGEVVAAISVSVPAVRGGAELSRRALEVLTAQAGGLSSVLGYQGGQQR